MKTGEVLGGCALGIKSRDSHKEKIEELKVKWSAAREGEMNS